MHKIMAERERSHSWRTIAGCFLISFFVPLVVSCMFFTFKNPLVGAGGLSEEYMISGWNQFHTGKHDYELASTSIPNLFRPPGYSTFIATTISLTCPELTPDPFLVVRLNDNQFSYPSGTIEQIGSICIYIYYMQSLLLAVSGVCICFMLFPYLGFRAATLLSLGFSLNPLLIVFVGMLHYEILSLFTFVIATTVLSYALRSGNRYMMLLAGGLFGVSTLVRPLTLILPLFILVVSWFSDSKDRKSFLWKNVMFVIGLLIVIAPWTLRNYRISGRLIPVNAQSGIAFWSSSATPLSLGCNVYHWMDLYEGAMKDVYVEKVSSYYDSFEDYVSRVLRIETVYKDEFVRNITVKPQVYMRNVIRNGYLYATGVNSIMLDAFHYIQDDNHQLAMQNFMRGDLNITGEFKFSSFYYVEMYTVSIVGLLGLCLAFFFKTPFGLASFAVYACLLVAHSISYMDLMYFYSKIPFLYIGIGVLIYLMDTRLLEKRHLKNIAREVIPAFLVATNLLILAVLFF